MQVLLEVRTTSKHTRVTACEVRQFGELEAVTIKQAGGPDGRRTREFHTSCDAVGERRWGGFPTYFPVSPSTRAATEAVVHTRRAHSIAPAQHAEIRHRERGGESLRTLAAVYGISHETIRRILYVSASSRPRTRRPIPARGKKPPRGGAA